MDILTLLGTKVAINTLTKPMKLLNFFKYILGLGAFVSLFFLVLGVITLSSGDAIISNKILVSIYNFFKISTTDVGSLLADAKLVTIITSSSFLGCLFLQVIIQHFATLSSTLSSKKEINSLYRLAKFELKSTKKTNAKVIAKGISRLDKKNTKHTIKQEKKALKTKQKNIKLSLKEQ